MGGAVGGGDVCAGVGGGVAVGAAVVGALVAGAELAGARVGALVVLMLGSGVKDALALGDADDVALAGASVPSRPSAKNAITSTVSRLPAIAASTRSTQRGPRRRGGMTRVVSPVMSGDRALGVPRQVRR